MIVFDLRCGANGHVFEAWFGSSVDYDEQCGRGLVQCPLCGDGEVTKAVMAPRVGAKGNRVEAGAETASVSSDAEGAKQMLAAIAAMQRKLLERSEDVGTRFADEARAIHLGEVEGRSIHGQATRDEAARLRDEGIEIAPLPFPVIAPEERN